MNFWNVLKYILMVIFAGILFVAIIVSEETQTQPQTIQQPGQSKFNF